MAPQENFFYSNLFVAIITFVVGTFGLYLYHRRKNDTKRRLAKIILLEIENAQEQLKEAKMKVLSNVDDPLPEHLYVMPTDSWSPNKHLFIDNFKPTEWSAINEFYELCQLYDEAITHNDSRFAEQEKEIRRSVHKANYKYAIECSEKTLNAKTQEEKDEIMQEFFRKRDNVMALFTDGDHMFIYTPSKQNQIVKTCLENVDVNLSLGIIGTRFSKLSKPKLMLF